MAYRGDPRELKRIVVKPDRCGYCGGPHRLQNCPKVSSGWDLVRRCPAAPTHIEKGIIRTRHAD